MEGGSMTRVADVRAGTHPPLPQATVEYLHGRRLTKTYNRRNGVKIIILGPGRPNLAESLVAENNDITVIDLDASRLALLQDRFDLRTVRGHAAHPSVLKQAGAEDADMLVAVTQSDETNLVACRIASTLFNVPSRIARIRSDAPVLNRK
jgi:Trk K+ transport system NAD-binding subunit